jgi:hypothetical protein
LTPHPDRVIMGDALAAYLDGPVLWFVETEHQLEERAWEKGGRGGRGKGGRGRGGEGRRGDGETGRKGDGEGGGEG